MTKFYTNAHYNPNTNEATFGVHCPSKGYSHSCHLPGNFHNSGQAEYAVIDRTVYLVNNQFVPSAAPNSRFEVYSDSARAVDRWNSLNPSSGRSNVHVSWSSRDSAGIQAADRDIVIWPKIHWKKLSVFKIIIKVLDIFFANARWKPP